MTAPVSIELKNISKHYGSTQVLTPFSLTLKAGCRTVLLGPSGCGKTTLLRMIAGLETPDEGGEIWIGGKNVTDLPPEKRRIGFMFQSYALFPNMTVSQNVAYGLKVRGASKAEIEATVKEMLELVNLEAFADRPVQALSGGQRQRVALARALAIRPRVLLLDEPLTALDALLRHKVREELAVLLKQLGITAVIVTHDQDEAMVLGDQIVVMQGGVIHQADNPSTVWQHPSSDFVAGFVGNSNRIFGEINGGDVSFEGVAAKLDTLCEETQSRLTGHQGEVIGFFRPDRAMLAYSTTHNPDILEIPVTVRDFHFMGNFVRISTELKNRHALVKVNVKDLAPSIKAGDEVLLCIPKHELMAFKG